MRIYYNILARLALTFLLMLSGCDKKGPDTINKSDLPIGVITALTGPNASYGRSTREGVEQAVYEINTEHFLSLPLRPVYEDDRMQAKDGVTAFQRLVAAEDPGIIIGPFGSSVVLAVSPLANETETVIISASATADGIAEAGDFVFRITPPNSKQGNDLAEFSYRKLGAKRAAVLFQKNDYGQTLKDAFIKKFDSIGGEVVELEGVNGGTTDFRAAIAKVSSKDPDVIFFPLHSQESTLFIRQARDAGIEVPMLSADGAMTRELLEGAGAAANNTYFSTLALDYEGSRDAIASFEDRFKSRHNGNKPDVYASYYYEVTWLIAQAINQVGTDSVKLRDYLYTLKGENAFRGITGITSFDKKGEVNKSFAIFQVRDGAFVRYGEN